MSETCKTCRKQLDSGIWMSPQFADEKVLLFCSESCKQHYVKMKLARIKANYPGYYDKIMKNPDGNLFASHIKNMRMEEK